MTSHGRSGVLLALLQKGRNAHADSSSRPGSKNGTANPAEKTMTLCAGTKAACVVDDKLF